MSTTVSIARLAKSDEYIRNSLNRLNAGLNSLPIQLVTQSQLTAP